MHQLLRAIALIATALALGPEIATLNSAADSQMADLTRPPTTNGQSATPLPSGAWLLIGGVEDGKPVSTAAVWDPRTGTTTVLPTGLSFPRTHHTATVLSDGTIMVVGGIGPQGTHVVRPERFDPTTRRFIVVRATLEPRASHSATLLTDGRLLIAGGFGPEGRVRDDAELWDPDSRADAISVKLNVGRSGHTATLLEDGTVEFAAGRTGNAGDIARSELYLPETNAFVRGQRTSLADDPMFLAASLPASGASDVPLDVRIALRFSQPLHLPSVSRETIVLRTADGPIDLTIVPAEAGRLVFVRPVSPLAPGTTYTLSVQGLVSGGAIGESMRPVIVTFTSIDTRERPTDAADDESWIPIPGHPNGWRTGRPDSHWRQLPPLQAPAGVTALAGQALLLNGLPLADVTLEVAGRSSRTDRSGRFLLNLQGLDTGHAELLIDGGTAGNVSKVYGLFEAGIDIVAGRTNILPYTIWMPRIDSANAVTISSPTTNETIVTTPFIPGLELHLAPNTVIRDHKGQPVTKISITPIPVDRPPFPLPHGVEVPVYFTIQPGGAYVRVTGSGAKGARLVYPNYTRQPAGARMNFWHYDPDKRGWYVYGQGSVDDIARQVVPDPGVAIYEFTGAMISSDGAPPAWWPAPGGGPLGADPVDLGTGLFVYEKTDLFLTDTMPIALARTYRQGDTTSRAFGIGFSHLYQTFLYSTQNYQWVDVILPDGGRLHYVRTSAGTGFIDAVYEHTTTPTQFYKSKISYNLAEGWNLTLTDGTVYVFGDYAPLQAIRDRYGNSIILEHSNGSIGNITRVSSPNNRWITFQYDSSNRITSATDNLNRTVSYTYDASGRLWKATDVAGGVTEYTYDAAHRMLTVKDPRGTIFLTNQYDANGRVSEQTQADTGVFEFDYTLDGFGRVTQTDLTDPEGHVQRTTFNVNGYAVTNIEALGTGLQRTTTFTRASGSNLLTAVVDPLSRRTEYGYDSNGNLTAITWLAGTVDAITTAFTYEAKFNQLATVTDPLNHTVTFSYDALGRLTAIANPLGQQASFTYNPAGQPLTITNALNETTSFAYELGDLVSTTDPLNQSTTRFVDGAGRVLSITDPLGRTRRFTYTALDLLAKSTDSLGAETSFTYDGNGNLLTVVDARGKTTTWTYDNMDRVSTRTDPLSRVQSYSYNLDGLLVGGTDRKSQVTALRYDDLHRVVFAGYNGSGSPAIYESTLDLTYDAGDRITAVVDSSAGTITHAYDLLNRLTEEETPQGTVTYTYDSAGRRSTMTVDGQSGVTYTYDSGDRLTGVSQGSNAVTLSYDVANRRTCLTLPNGIVVESGYDAAGQLTALTYKLSGTTLGTLTYEYDAGGQKTVVGGTYARTNLPAQLASAAYDDANQISTFAGTSFSYDANGNMTSDGSATFTWNARNQLTAISGGVTSAYAYDALGRRRTRTVGSNTTEFLFDGVTPVQELVSGTPNANLLIGLGMDEYFVRSEGSSERQYLVDESGSSIALTDSLGAVQTEYTYEPFGKIASQGAATQNAFTFAGREDDGTGLIFMRARYYSPRLQRFLGEDPIGFAGGDADLHAYVANSPTNWTDGTGLSPNGIPPDCQPGQRPSKTVMNPFGVTCSPEPLIGVVPFLPGGPLFGPRGPFLGPGGGGPGRPPNLRPDPRAVGPHTTFSRAPNGTVRRYQSWEPQTNPRNPSPWTGGPRYSSDGSPHFNKSTGEYVDPPHVHDPMTPGKVRPARPGEIPRGPIK